MFEQHSSGPAFRTEGPRSTLRRFVNFSWLVIALATIVVGGILYTRWDQNRRIEKEAMEKKREADRRDFEAMGGNRFEIRHFYASPGVIARGESAQLCYGVSNAKTVRIEPPAGTVWPSYNRCLYISPAKDTTFTLTIEDEGGQTRTASLTLQVR
ncbi:MAG: hypothetical protein ACRD5F_00750 [Candidatus Acidiferrales bacterium]